MTLRASNTVIYHQEANIREGLSNVTEPRYSPFTLSLIPPDIGLTLPTATQPAKHLPQYDEALEAMHKVRETQVPNVAQRLPPQKDVVRQNGKIYNTDQAASVATPLQSVDAVQDLVDQWADLVSTEPLTWMINPQSFSVAYSKIAQFSEATRKGFVYQAWGDDEPRISITGTIGGFYSADRGLHWMSRHDSVAWQHFMEILTRFRNGAAIYDRAGGSRALRAVGWQRIDYDGVAWIGHMESFDYSVEADKPHGGWPFTIEFVVSRQIGTDDIPTDLQPYSQMPLPQELNIQGSSPVGPSASISPPAASTPTAFRKVST